MAARITGVFGAVYIGAVGDNALAKVLDVFDWSFEPTVETLPCDIKSDIYHKFAVGAGGARFTAKRRLQAGSVFNSLSLAQASARGQLLFRLDLVDANNGFAQITGQGFVSGGSLGAPQAPVDDTIEVTFDGVWVQT